MEITGLADFRALKSFDQEIPHPSPDEGEIISYQNF
jgi:hypothetical protein